VIPDFLVPVLYALVYILVAPLLGGLIAGIDRKVTARMQGRVGPPILQPFYDVGKLFEKENAVVTVTQNFYVLSYLVFMMVAGALFFSGGDLCSSYLHLLYHIYSSCSGRTPHTPRTAMWERSGSSCRSLRMNR